MLLPMASALAAVVALTACGAPSRAAAFADVADEVDARGAGRIHWHRGGPEDDAVARELHELLRRELTADDAVRIALLANRRLQAVYEDVGVAQADLVQAGLLRNPVLDAEARFIPGGGVDLELSLVQGFLDLVFIPMRRRMAEAALEAAKRRVAGAVIDVAGDVRRAAYAYQAATQALDMRRTIVEATAASFELAQRIHAAGNSTALDLAEQRLLVEEATGELHAAEADAGALRERLTALMGLWGADTAWTMAVRLPDPPAAEAPDDGVERRAVEASLALAAAKQDVAVAAQRLGVARPLDVFDDGGVGVSAERSPEGEWAAGPAVSVPLPLFSRGQGAVLAARSDLRRAEAVYQATAVEVRSRARLAAARVRAARGRMTHLVETMIPLRQAIVDRLQEEYNGMLASPFRLIEAKRRQIDAGARYVEALGSYWSARSALDQILMGGAPPLIDSAARGEAADGRGTGEGAHR
ncbi:MAG TPA: TolC family protein [Planctomycetota bacterium]|nr:TolC family protein [Planctomycetota bacterium]